MALDAGTVALILAAGVIVGVTSALFGVGGGVLMVAFMVLALDRSQHVAEGTSLLAIVPTALAGVLAHRRKGYVSLRVAGLMGLGGIGGAYLGAVVALSLDGEALQTIFGAVLLVVGIRTVTRGLAAGRSAAPRKHDPPVTD